MAYKSRVWDGTQWVEIANSIPKAAAGGGTDGVFFENDNAITTSYTITTNKNAFTAGPITINSGVVITIPSGSAWVIA
jgi:hypothetical protein